MQAATNKKFPPLKWAQRSDCVLITIEVPDCENIQIDINEENNQLVFSALAN